MTDSPAPVLAEAAPLTAEQAEPSCSKCDAPLDTNGYPKWCKKCRATNKREYEATKKEMQETRGYAAGTSAMRAYLAEKFLQYGTAGSFSGAEIAGIIRGCRGPV